MPDLNATHDPARRSWVASACAGDFPLQNLPFGRFRRADGAVRCGVAIGDQVLDLGEAFRLGLFSGEAAQGAEAAAGDDLLPLLRLGARRVSPLRARLFDLLAEGGDDAVRRHAERLLVAQANVAMRLPTTARQFSDMCVSTFHIGRRAGVDERGQPICPPVFRTQPVGYDGRASSVVVSGTPVTRPNGQWTQQLFGGELSYGPEPRQDYELEVAVWLGGDGNALGSPMTMTEASEALFGLGLMNDWSARGIQLWETMLGPFLGKSLATTASPWIVTAEALAPFRVEAFHRPEGDPAAPPHLHDGRDQNEGHFDIALSAHISTARSPLSSSRICLTNFRHMYWTVAQMICHHASNGCSLAAGDLLGSGTCSGPQMSEAACLLEANLDGPIELQTGESRDWLLDGDKIVLSGRASRNGFVSIGFGEAAGTLAASISPSLGPEGMAARA